MFNDYLLPITVLVAGVLILWFFSFLINSKAFYQISTLLKKTVSLSKAKITPKQAGGTKSPPVHHSCVVCQEVFSGQNQSKNIAVSQPKAFAQSSVSNGNTNQIKGKSGTLIGMVLDQAVADRLIEFERKRSPGASYASWEQDAVDRLRRDIA